MVNRPQKLLFICVENSNRSQMAEAFAMIHGQNRIEVLAQVLALQVLLIPKPLNQWMS